MQRYLVAALGAGIVHAMLAPVFVHYVLDASMREELINVLGQVMRSAPRSNAAAGANGWTQLLLHLAVRVVLGGVTAGVFAVLQRRRPRFRAARLAGVAIWGIGYVVWPLLLVVQYAMPITLLFVCIGYGLVETQLAAHVAALLWSRNRPAAA